MAKFLRDLVRGVSRSSDQWPQIVLQRQQMQAQRAGIARQEQEGKRSRLMSLLQIAMASNDPDATAAGLSAMQQSGLFPEFEALGGTAPPVASGAPIAPSKPSPSMPGLSMPPGRTMTAQDVDPQMSPGFAGETAASRIVPQKAAPVAAETPSTGNSFFDSITKGVAEKKRLKVEEEQRKVATDERAERAAIRAENLERLRLRTEERLAGADERKENELYQTQVMPDGTLWKRDKGTGEIRVVGALQLQRMSERQRYELSAITQKVSNQSDKRTPKELLKMWEFEATAAGIPIDPELRSLAQANFDESQLSLSPHIRAADQTKMRDFNTAQDIAKGGLQQLSAIPVDQQL